MRICAQDEIIYRRTEELTDQELRAWQRQLLSDFSKYGHGKDFRPQPVENFISESAVSPLTLTVGEEMLKSFTQVPTKTNETTNGSFVPWSGPPRAKCEKRYQLSESPRLARISEGGPCHFGSHAMDAGDMLYVAHAIDLSTGEKRDLWGCEECAEKLM